MNVTIACEFSGSVREAIRRRGHNVRSYDLIPAEDDSDLHIVGDVRLSLSDGWSDVLIAHPPCTFLANSANKHLYRGMLKANGKNPKRWRDMRDAAEFFLELWNAPIEKIAVENPIMGKHAKAIVGVRQTQTVQPWMFGHGETKAICLWLKNLPPLVPTNVVDGRKPRVHFESPSPDRWKNRSRTYAGLAEAMADQWTPAFSSQRFVT